MANKQQRRRSKKKAKKKSTRNKARTALHKPRTPTLTMRLSRSETPFQGGGQAGRGMYAGRGCDLDVDMVPAAAMSSRMKTHLKKKGVLPDDTVTLLPFEEIPGAMYCTEETLASFDKTHPEFRRHARKMQAVDGDGWMWVIAPAGPLGNMKPLRGRIPLPPGENDE